MLACTGNHEIEAQSDNNETMFRSVQARWKVCAAQILLYAVLVCLTPPSGSVLPDKSSASEYCCAGALLLTQALGFGCHAYRLGCSKTVDCSPTYLAGLLGLVSKHYTRNSKRQSLVLQQQTLDKCCGLHHLCFVFLSCANQ